ncbi:MAG: outer membrane beta-barrel protein, partial [Prevotella sp.]|nr:outer membrane beta-barrel protein [Prevotella sp.]
PYLLPTYTHSLVLNAAYKWANLTVNYGRMKNSETMSTEPFPGSTDPLISLVRPINSEEDYNQLSLSLSARPNFQFSIFNSQLKWHPMWYAFTVFQNYKTPTANGSIKTLNDPYVTLVWNNDIELPHSFRLTANAQWATKGDYNNFSITAQRFDLTLGVQRDFNLRSLGQLTLDVRCVDVLNTNKTAAVIYGIRELSTDNPARRTFLVNLNWKFNEARSKYRGSGAGEKQKARM